MARRHRCPIPDPCLSCDVLVLFGALKAKLVEWDSVEQYLVPFIVRLAQAENRLRKRDGEVAKKLVCICSLEKKRSPVNSVTENVSMHSGHRAGAAAMSCLFFC